MKKTLTLTFSLLAAVALASGGLIHSIGKGRLFTADGRSGSFDYEVNKRTAANGSASLSGRFRFEQQRNANGPYVLIEEKTLTTLSRNGNVAEFSGHAVLTTPVNGKNASYGGTIAVRVVDRHNSTTNVGEPDLFRVRFVGEKGLTFTSEGTVTSGDLTVSGGTAP